MIYSNLVYEELTPLIYTFSPSVYTREGRPYTSGFVTERRAIGMISLRSDQLLALILMVLGIWECPRICLVLAMSWLSWDTIISCE